MKIEDLSKPLPIDMIDFRIQSINKGGYATILAYKDARADMNRLDEVVGAFNWKREHTRDNANCIISIWDNEKKQWIPKEDTGAESFTEKEKGLASDSFKRSGFNWGIGRELYDYPLIQIKLYQNEFEIKNDKVYSTWDLRLRDWKWEGKFNDKKLVFLRAEDYKGNERFLFKDGEKISKIKPSDKAWIDVIVKVQTGEFDKDEVKAKLILTPEQIKELDKL